jgi:hypothetical protein
VQISTTIEYLRSQCDRLPLGPWSAVACQVAIPGQTLATCTSPQLAEIIANVPDLMRALVTREQAEQTQEQLHGSYDTLTEEHQQLRAAVHRLTIVVNQLTPAQLARVPRLRNAVDEYLDKVGDEEGV